MHRYYSRENKAPRRSSFIFQFPIFSNANLQDFNGIGRCIVVFGREEEKVMHGMGECEACKGARTWVDSGVGMQYSALKGVGALAYGVNGTALPRGSMRIFWG
jgi:hypothetical protein